MSLEIELQQFIATEVIPDGSEIGVTFDEPLISSGRVDSLGLLDILGFIQQRYNVDLLSVAGPKDFESITLLAQAITRAQGKG